MSATAPTLRVVEAQAFERPVSFRFPFRFGAAKVTAAPQAFLRVRIEDGDGRGGFGWSAEMMMPKWFDKRPELSPEQNVDQLRRALRLAIEAMTAAGGGTAFGLHARVEADHHRACAAEGLPGLVASYGLALVDRAIIDALCRMEGVGAAEAVRTNRLGLTAATAPDLDAFDLDGFLAGLAPSETIAVRHTVGLADALEASDLDAATPDDGLPRTLEAAIAAYGHRFFKLKVSGQPAADVARLERIAAVLDAQVGDYRVTLDGNEQFDGVDAVVDFLDRLDAAPGLARLRAAILFLEQPLPRVATLSQPIAALAARLPVEIDEADGDIDAFVKARDLGYTGVSSKSCKGFYRALLNRARVAQWNAEAGTERYFLSAEDLTTQAGIAVQQDLVLAALVGAGHVERNGHHYVDGMAGAPEAEQRAFLDAHGDLYTTGRGRTRVAIRDGRFALGSVLAAPGLGSRVEPDWAAMSAMS